MSILESLKGQLASPVTITQIGGTDSYGNTWIVDEDPLLEIGAVYLFVTRKADEAFYGQRLTPVHGRILAQTAARRQELVARFREAVRQQIPYPR